MAETDLVSRDQIAAFLTQQGLIGTGLGQNLGGQADLLTQLAELLEKANDAEKVEDAGFRPEDTVEFKNFESAVRAVHGQEEAGAEEDEDVVIAPTEFDVARNRSCPITGKPVMELTEPVEDQLGFVYERKEIEEYIRRKRGSCACPMAATSHTITLADLKKANKVLREQRRQQHATQPTQEDDTILDV
ncbi:hypothetical protein WJX72_004993 [[Myrmecia] bisecta]|uniref:E3 SUMO-protein ligase NSE2 n=1 Tax=[Myrmecia] bisecta TaxID=41462 RepID=A0AAW1R6K3_9CHLO